MLGMLVFITSHLLFYHCVHSLHQLLHCFHFILNMHFRCGISAFFMFSLISCLLIISGGTCSYTWNHFLVLQHLMLTLKTWDKHGNRISYLILKVHSYCFASYDCWNPFVCVYIGARTCACTHTRDVFASGMVACEQLHHIPAVE